MKECFRSIFGSNENYKICFQDYLTFSSPSNTRGHSLTTLTSQGRQRKCQQYVDFTSPMLSYKGRQAVNIGQNLVHVVKERPLFSNFRYNFTKANPRLLSINHQKKKIMLMDLKTHTMLTFELYVNNIFRFNVIQVMETKKQ